MLDLLLAILVPSRGRPHNMVRLAKAVAETCKVPYRIYCRVDDNDPTNDAYSGIPDIVLVNGPQIHFVASVNELAALATDATHFAILGDDVLPETVGWDAKLIDALGGRVGVAYGSDGLEHLHVFDLPTHVVVPVEMFRQLGWIALPALRHLYSDNVWRDIGKGVDNFVYCPDVKLTHLHRWTGLAPDDDTYRDANDFRYRRADKAAYIAWRNGPGYIDAMKTLQ